TLMFALLVCCPGMAAEDQRIDILNFEDLADPFSLGFTGGTIVESWAEEFSYNNVPAHQGEWGMYGYYDTSAGRWSQTRLDFPEPVDLTGMTELHFWIYFFEDAQPHQSGEFRMRTYIPNGAVLDEAAVVGAGEWHHVVMPIDRWSSENEMSSFNNLRIIWNPGADNDATGRFYIDEMYGFRPGNTPQIKDVMVYGFNEEDPETGYPKGWTVRDDTAGLFMGDAFVEPSEGSDYLELMLPGGWVRLIETENSLNDFDQWGDVYDITVDVRMSEDFSSWHNFHLYLDSSAGGNHNHDIRSVGGSTDSWKTVSWRVDMTPYLPALEDPDGWFRISFLTQTGTEGGSVFIDNLRVGIAALPVVSQRSFSQDFYKEPEAITVSIALTAEEAVSGLEVLETVPEGWTVSNISDGGSFADGEVSWTLDLPVGEKTVTYDVQPPADAQASVAFEGTIDGVKIKGDQMIAYVWGEIPYVESANVTLDGEIASGEYDGAYTETVSLESNTDKTPPGVFIGGDTFPENDQFTIHLLNNADSIYIAVDMVDDDLAFNENADQAWNNDSVELYFDGNFSKMTGSKEGNALGCQLTTVGNGRIQSGQGAGDLTVEREGDTHAYSTGGSFWNFATRVKDDNSGWITEYQLDKAEVLDPADISMVGFDIKINGSDSGAGGRTSNWAYWFTNGQGVVADDYWDDESGWSVFQIDQGGTDVSDWSLF
ncbi:hypothetical protein GF373_03290, partial [bacterium]|nr:hypothetical protein [bacterium]